MRMKSFILIFIFTSMESTLMIWKKITTDPMTVKYHKNNLPNQLRERYLHINETKTEEYAIKRAGDNGWKDCILLGSKLDTDSDIKRRTGLTVGVIHELRYIFYSNRLSVSTKVRVFDVFVSSIFLYNAELWTLTTTKEKKLDALHRRLLRTSCLNMRWPKIASAAKKPGFWLKYRVQRGYPEGL